ncbi:hypothetical protein ACFRMQ_07545 [Kitasatospora sp. NPDC056783]|uniref:hypothetical protein n=1 Tax=Kitasatospora sp. NPDC056783 TaxID=3345943 RepID=UPI0036BEE802
MAITTGSNTSESDITRDLTSAQYLAIAATVSTAVTAVICAGLHEPLLALAMLLTCLQQVTLQMKLQRLQRTTITAFAAGRIPRQRDKSN